MTKRLAVWLNENHVGYLELIAGRPCFVYSQAWLDQPNAYALSQSLPLQSGFFDEQTTRPFFAGLLPEGENRRLIAKSLQVSEQNDFGLLDQIGGECAGAVTFYPPEQSPPSFNTELVRWLDEQGLQEILNTLPTRPLLAGEEGVRLSLAGAQDKLAVVVDPNGRIGLPFEGGPSSHILKPAISRFQDTVANEAFCMQLAEAMGLKTAKTEMRSVFGNPYLLVERYDRQTDPLGTRVRLHQEDFCQALGTVPEHKYQNEGGPGFADCFDLLRKVTHPPAPQILRMLDAVIFNVLIGNHDAHGKNFSLLMTPSQITMAPLYDLLCTTIYEGLSLKMAMKLGGKYKFTEIERSHWELFAKESKLSASLVKKRVLHFTQKLPESAEILFQSKDYRFKERAVCSEIIAQIKFRSELTARQLRI